MADDVRALPPGPSAVVPVALPTGNTPLWSRDGKTLFFFAGAGNAPFTAAHLAIAPALKVQSTSAVFARAAPGTGISSPTQRWTNDMLSNGDVYYVTQAAPPAGVQAFTGGAPSAAIRVAAFPDFQSKVIAIVNWVGAERTATPPR